MIKKSDDRVWIYSDISKKYYLLGAGLTDLKEVCKTALLETPNVNSALCGREVLYHTAQLEFEGFRVEDEALEMLLSRHLKRGSDAQITFVIVNRKDVLSGTVATARRITGYVCVENPGTGEGPFGSRFKGKIVYSTMPERGVFDEGTKTFS